MMKKNNMRHKGYSNIFKPGKLTFGFMSPMVGYPDSPVPDISKLEKIVSLADQGGISAIWLRDVPFLDPQFGDAGQVYDPMVYGSYLAGKTSNITIGTAGIVLPLRDPLIVAKQAATLDQLSEGRFLLGLASGDRFGEYPAFGCDFETRSERFREARQIIKKVTEESFPQFRSEFYGSLDGTLDLIPKPISGHIPTISIGRGGQSIEWISNNMDGWIWHGDAARNVKLRVQQLEQAADHDRFIPYGYGQFFDLSEDRFSPLVLSNFHLSGGRDALIEFWEEQRKEGLSHIILNIKPTRRPADELIQEFTEFIVPHFA